MVFDKKAKRIPIFVMEDGGQEYELTCCGYLDITKESFPSFTMPWNGKTLNYLIVSKKTFGKMECKPLVYQISFDVEESREAKIKQAIQLILISANQNAGISNSYELLANSDLLAEEEGYIFAATLVMGTFSIILIILAVINYGNTVITGMVSREMEFKTMIMLYFFRPVLFGMVFPHADMPVICQRFREYKNAACPTTHIFGIRFWCLRALSAGVLLFPPEADTAFHPCRQQELRDCMAANWFNLFFFPIPISK